MTLTFADASKADAESTSSATAEIARIGCRYAVQDHSKSLISKPIESPYYACDLLLMNNNNLHPISCRSLLGISIIS